MEKQQKGQSRCTPGEAFVRLASEDQRWIMARLLSAAIGSIRSDPRSRNAALDQVEAAKDAAHDGVVYLLELRKVQKWTGGDLFRVAKWNGSNFLKKDLRRALKWKEVPYPDQEPPLGEPRGHDAVLGGTPRPNLLDAQAHEAACDGADSAERRAAAFAELCDKMTEFFAEHTGLFAETKADIRAYIERCRDERDDILWVGKKSRRIWQHEAKLAEELRWPIGRVRQILATMKSYRNPLLAWLKAEGCGDLLEDVLGAMGTKGRGTKRRRSHMKPD